LKQTTEGGKGGPERRGKKWVNCGRQGGVGVGGGVGGGGGKGKRLKGRGKKKGKRGVECDDLFPTFHGEEGGGKMGKKGGKGGGGWEACGPMSKDKREDLEVWGEGVSLSLSYSNKGKLGGKKKLKRVRKGWGGGKRGRERKARPNFLL